MNIVLDVRYIALTWAHSISSNCWMLFQPKRMMNKRHTITMYRYTRFWYKHLFSFLILLPEIDAHAMTSIYRYTKRHSLEWRNLIFLKIFSFVCKTLRGGYTLTSNIPEFQLRPYRQVHVPIFTVENCSVFIVQVNKLLKCKWKHSITMHVYVSSVLLSPTMKKSNTLKVKNGQGIQVIHFACFSI